MESPLFRPEVIHAETTRWLGTVRIVQPISSWLLVSVSGILAIFLIAYLALGNIARKTHVAGITVPAAGSFTISAPATAVIKATLVKEGQKVSKNDALFDLSMERVSDKGEISALIGAQLSIRQQTLESERRTKKEQYDAKRIALKERASNTEVELAQLDQEVKLAEYREKLAIGSIEKYRVLKNDGFVSSAQCQQKEEDLIDIRSRLMSLKRSKVQLLANRISLHSETRDLESNFASDMAQLDLSAATLRQEIAENEGRKSLLVRSPQAGTITTITYSQGQSVNAGQVIANLVPASAGAQPSSDLEVHLFVPSRSVGFIEAGQHVNIRYDAFPFQKFGLQEGIVDAVSTTPFAPSELPSNLASTVLGNAQKLQGMSASEGLYRVKVKLLSQKIAAYGRDQYLKPGMTVEVDIVQERRKIWEWIAEPIFAVWHRQ